LELNAKFAETERELGLARDQVLDVICPWHEETCARRRAHEAAVPLLASRNRLYLLAILDCGTRLVK
jgi:hypothetical protein